jgi:Abortive infection C-terminus
VATAGLGGPGPGWHAGSRIKTIRPRVSEDHLSRRATPRSSLMTAHRELIALATRIAFRELAGRVVIRDIDNLWQAEGFAPASDPTTLPMSERRAVFQSYMDAVNWTDERHVTRAVRVFERMLHDHFLGSNLIVAYRAREEIERDGYRIDNDGRIKKTRISFRPGALANLTDATAIHDGLERIRRAEQDEDPALVIGVSKELIESTAKLALHELDESINPRADIQELIRATQKSLQLLPGRAPGPDGTEAVKKILGSAAAIAIGVAELRNRGYGTGHGQAVARHGLSSRHAHLAANAAITWCELILETLADPQAPWRLRRSDS